MIGVQIHNYSKSKNIFELNMPQYLQVLFCWHLVWIMSFVIDWLIESLVCVYLMQVVQYTLKYRCLLTY